MEGPKVILVIESYHRRGNGEPHNPHRVIKQYHTLGGVFLAEEKDIPIHPKQRGNN